MIQLALVRHAKSDLADPATDDHDRPLNARGLREAPEMARRILRGGVRPGIVLSSTALRARTTAEYFAAAFGAEVHEIAELYGAPPAVLLETARASRADEVMVVAHDPGVSELASELSGEEVRMTTCAVAVFTWDDADWSDVGILPPDTFALTTPS